MSAVQHEDRIATAIAMREAGQVDQARRLLLEMHAEDPDDAIVNLQCAWVHDKMGLEAEAVPFYEAAIRGGLDGDNERNALLGLGSTYRALGRYPEALATLARGVDEFPEDRAMAVFLAMALYNNGESKEACQALLRVVSDTTADDRIQSYRRAIDIYAEDLDRTWS
jgi:predicted Zn-dependent protease